MEQNMDKIAQLLLSGGESKEQAMNDKVDKIANLFQNDDDNAKNKAKQLLEGGFEENFMNYDEKLKQSLESEEEQKKYSSLAAALVGEEGKKQCKEARQSHQISQLNLLGAGFKPDSVDVDLTLQQALQELQFGGKIATKQELKEIHKNPKLMNSYEEYEELEEVDHHGLHKIRKVLIVNHYDLSKYLSTISSLTMSGQKYKDPDFPPSKKTLLGDGSNKDGLQWLSGPNAVTIFRRCNEIFGEDKFHLFKGGIEPQDMNQGNIGNCYFMGSIAALAETPSRISKLFVNNEANPSGCYAINVCEQGLWRELIIDDYIPCYKSNGQPAFAHNNGNEIWAMLIEKVWAKMYGGYANIIGGLGREVFNEMTGAPCQTLFTKNPQTFEEIYKGEQFNWPMCCASNQGSGSHDNKTAGGIANSHLYTMLGGYKVNYQGKQVQLVRLRNPWGKCEWKGAFGDEWAGWNDPNLKKQVPYEKKDDGIFYMTFQDFQKEFSHVDICMYFDNYKFSTLSCVTKCQQPSFFEITITTPGSYFFIAVQKSSRKTKRKDYQLSRVGITLAVDQNNKIYPVRFAKNPASFPNIDQWIYCQKLDAGKYILGVNCAWYDKKPHRLTLKSYGENFIEFNSADAHRYANLKF